jgi:DNA/RNA-binding domain of Phe-tRNA-synthetase-like protein
MSDADADADAGWVSDDLRAEAPDLGLASLRVGLAHATTAMGAHRQRLVDLERYFEGRAMRNLPARPVTAAQRIFLRQIGLDPDVDRTAAERCARERLTSGSFVERGFLDDALTIVAVETEIDVRALDAAHVVGPLGLRTAAAGEAVGRAVAPGSLVVADAARPLALLFGPERSPFAPTAASTDLVLYAAHVPGVHAAVVTEALWVAQHLLSA